MSSDFNRSPFAGFWMGGFEGADHVNGSGEPLDMVRASGHLEHLDEDYRRSAQAGMRCVRESIGWRLSETRDGHIDLSRALHIHDSARRHGLQVIWTLMHYGVPEGLSVYDDALIPRFARFSAHVARSLGRLDPKHPLVITPINEISYLAWAASQPGSLLQAPQGLRDSGEGDVASEQGYDVKRRLVRASLHAMTAIRAFLPGTRFMHVEPLIHVHAPVDAGAASEHASRMNAWQWQAFDLLAGRLEPGLGGGIEVLDLVGVNHYHLSQWDAQSGQALDWARRDSRRRPLRQLLVDAWGRYGRPLVVAETGHVGEGRAAWLHDAAHEIAWCCRSGVPVMGLCLYPLVDRPDWSRPSLWHRCGLWHVDHSDPRLPRREVPETLDALKLWRKVLPQALQQSRGHVQPTLLVYSEQTASEIRSPSDQMLAALAELPLPWRVVLIQVPSCLACMGYEVYVQGPHLFQLSPRMDSTSRQVSGDIATGPTRSLQQWVQELGLHEHMAWVNASALISLARSMNPKALILDDDPHACTSAEAVSSDVEDRLQQADRVCTGAPWLSLDSLSLSGSGWNERRHSGFGRPWRLPVGVDTRVFAPIVESTDTPMSWAQEEAARIAAPLWQCGGPQIGVLGLYGNCVDVDLLCLLAAERSSWQFVLLNPSAMTLPVAMQARENVHVLRNVPTQVLPALMCHWQLALLCSPGLVCARVPTRGDAMRMLEVLSIGLPVLTSGLDLYSLPISWRRAGVWSVDSAVDSSVSRPEAILRCCERMLAELPRARTLRQKRARRLVQRSAWSTYARSLDVTLLHRWWNAGPSPGSIASDAASSQSGPEL